MSHRLCPNCKRQPITKKTWDYCATCHRHITIERQHAFKRALLAYKNEKHPNRCSHCHKDFHQATLCLRHVVQSPDNVYISKFCGSPNLSEACKAELSKCAVLCKNCEASLYRSAKKPSPLKKKALAFKGGQCSKCGHNGCASSLEFHHIDGRGAPTKRLTLGQRGLKYFSEILEELKKVVILCANCHSTEHAVLKERERKMEKEELYSAAKATPALAKQIEEELEVEHDEKELPGAKELLERANSTVS